MGPLHRAHREVDGPANRLNSSQQVNSVTSYFDYVAPEYAKWYETPSAAGQALRARQRRALELLDHREGRILDVGCGPGVLATDLLERGYEYWGVDASPRMVEFGQKSFGHGGRVQFSVGDATRLSFPNNVFSAVICLGVLDRIPRFDRAIHEIVRVTRPGGTVLISFANLLSPYAAWKRFVYYPVVHRAKTAYSRLSGRPRVPSLLPLEATLHTPRSAASLIDRCGACVTDVVYYHFNPLLSPLDELLPHTAQKVVSALETLHRGPLRWLGAGFIVKAAKPQVK